MLPWLVCLMFRDPSQLSTPALLRFSSEAERSNCGKQGSCYSAICTNSRLRDDLGQKLWSAHLSMSLDPDTPSRRGELMESVNFVISRLWPLTAFCALLAVLLDSVATGLALASLDFLVQPPKVLLRRSALGANVVVRGLHCIARRIAHRVSPWRGHVVISTCWRARKVDLFL